MNPKQIAAELVRIATMLTEPEDERLAADKLEQMKGFLKGLEAALQDKNMEQFAKHLRALNALSGLQKLK